MGLHLPALRAKWSLRKWWRTEAQRVPLSSHTLHGVSLHELFRTRSTIQRKHILRTLAIEAGFQNWEDYRWALRTMSVDQLGHFDMIQREIGYPNFWFSTLAQAQEHALKHGGRTMQVGQQAVVLPLHQT